MNKKKMMLNKKKIFSSLPCVARFFYVKLEVEFKDSNYGTFKQVKVKDVAENTFRNFKTNKFVITDKNFRFADKSNGSIIEVAKGAVGRLVIQGKNAKIKTKGNVEIKPHGKKASISKVEVEGGKLILNLKQLINAITEILIQKAAVVDITGGKDAKLNVVVGKEAKGATIKSDSTVNLVVNAEIVINLIGNAGGSKIEVADGVKVEVVVGSDVKGTVTVGDTEVKAGDKVKLEVCDKCHPFFTGQQKVVDTEGRVDKFNKKHKLN